MTSNVPPLVIFHYDFSPWGRKLRSYLALRNIPYSSCQQPVTMPRPDLAELDIAYRRIPLLAVGKDFYCDTDLAIQKLEKFYPASSQHPDLNATTTEGKALEAMLEAWVESQVWKYAAYAIPTSLDAVFQNKDFLEDRTKLFGREWSKENQEKLRVESDYVLRANFEFLNDTLLADGRKWLLGNQDSPGLADVYVGFIFDWMRDVGGCWPSDMNEDSGNYKHFWAWVNRFRDAVAEANKKNGEVKELESKAAIAQILNDSYAESSLTVDKSDPTGLQQGDRVQAYPNNYGSAHKDTGELVGLTKQEAVVQNSKGLRIHHPRFQFLVEKVASSQQVNGS